MAKNSDRLFGDPRPDLTDLIDGTNEAFAWGEIDKQQHTDLRLFIRRAIQNDQDYLTSAEFSEFLRMPGGEAALTATYDRVSERLERLAVEADSYPASRW